MNFGLPSSLRHYTPSPLFGTSITSSSTSSTSLSSTSSHSTSFIPPSTQSTVSSTGPSSVQHFQTPHIPTDSGIDLGKMPTFGVIQPVGEPPNPQGHPQEPDPAMAKGLRLLPVEILTMIFRNLPAEDLVRIARTSYTFAESAAYILRTRMSHAFEIPEPTLLFTFGPPDTYPESVKCIYMGISGLSNSPEGQQVMTDAFAIFHPTPYSPADMPTGGPSVDESLTREVVFEESEKFAQFTGNLSLVLALEIAFIADGTTIGGKMVIRLQRDWLEKESSKIISLDHQNTIKILVEVRKMAVDTFEIRVTELHICAARMLVALEKTKDTKNRGIEHIRLPIALPAGNNRSGGGVSRGSRVNRPP